MRRMILLLNTVLLFGMFGPAAAQDSLPPAPYAYRQLDDPQQEAAAQAAAAADEGGGGAAADQ